MPRAKHPRPWNGQSPVANHPLGALFICDSPLLHGEPKSRVGITTWYLLLCSQVVGVFIQTLTLKVVSQNSV